MTVADWLHQSLLVGAAASAAFLAGIILGIAFPPLPRPRGFGFDPDDDK